MRTYEVSAREMFERQTESYLRAVASEVRLLSVKDPFFDSVKASLVGGRVRHQEGTFRFRFDPGHRGRPWSGPEYRIDPSCTSLSLNGTEVPIGGELGPDSLLDAVRRILVQEVMEL